jgi:hypothetical protein
MYISVVNANFDNDQKILFYYYGLVSITTKGNDMSVTLKDVGSGYKRTAINSNFEAIEAEINNNLLNKNGGVGLEADLDANSQKIINLADGINSNEAVNLRQLQGAISAAGGGLIASQTEVQLGSQAVADVFTFTGITYTVGSNNLYVFRNGQKLGKGVDYTETSTSSITLLFTPNANDRFEFVTNISTTNSTTTTSAITHTQSGTDYNLSAYLQRSVPLYVEDFGVDGSGSAADKAAWDAAIAEATTSNVQLHCRPGATYIFDPESNGTVEVNPTDGQSFFLNGNNCTFKFKDSMSNTAGRFWHMILVAMRTSSGITNQDAEQVIFENIVVDGNYRNQPTPGSISDYEQRSALKVLVVAGDGNRLKLAKFKNIVQVDPMADTLFIGPGESAMTSDGESPINNVVVDTFHAGARNSARAAIQLSSGAGRINISNVTRDKALGSERNSIETEFTQIDAQKVEVNITNCFIDVLEFGGLLGKEDQFQVNLNNCVLPSTGFLLMVRGNLRAVNCTFPFSESSAQRYKEVRLDNCEIIHNVYDDGGTQDARTLNLLPENTSTTESLWWESNCTHVINGTVDPAANNPAIAGTTIAAADQFNHEIRLDNVIFDENFARSVQGYRTGFLNTSNCVFAGDDHGVQCGSDATLSGSWTSKDDDFSKVTGDNFNFLATGTTAEVRLLGGVWDTLDFAGSNVANISAGIKQSSRVIQATATPTGGGAIGDIVKLDSASYALAASSADIEWSCVSAHPTAATWVATLQKS